MQDLTAILPNGKSFVFWEKEAIYDRELIVDASAAEGGDGSASKPFRTINEAAAIATPGTRVRIHAGIYRETVQPAQGGESPEKMISYEAYGDGEVSIRASVVATEFYPSTEWSLFRGRASVGDPVIWGTKLNPHDFMGYNPFCAVNILHDRLYIEYEKTDMTTYLLRRGMVFVDGKPLQQVSLYTEMSQIPGSYWVEANGQTVHFRLPDDGDPKDHLIELSAREQCFAPEKPFLAYIRVKGLTCAHAATGAPVPQRGSISMSRGHHWIIEDCTIDWSNCVGMDIGSECWHRTRTPGQIVGHAIIRRNKIMDAGVCGIAGMGASYCLIEDNLIQGTGWQKMELSWEAGAIKTHNSVDCLIRRNIFTKTLRCDHLWMDCGNCNNRITQNLFLDGIEQREAIFMECTRDEPNLIDNNVIWNVQGRFNEADVPHIHGSATWYAMGEENSIINGWGIYGEGTDHLRICNNLIGRCRSAGYFQKTVAYRLAGRGGTARDNNLFQNIFYDCGEAAIKFPTDKNQSEGNVFVQMPSGYLRILYPQPAECLDLETWQEFHGFDMTGVDGDFSVNVDTDNYTLTISAAPAPMFPFFRFGKGEMKTWEQLPKLDAMDLVPSDFFGNEAAPQHIAGPFPNAEMNVTFSIDPRKLV